MRNTAEFPSALRSVRIRSLVPADLGVQRVAAWGAQFPQWEAEYRMSAALVDSKIPEEWSGPIIGSTPLGGNLPACTVYVWTSADFPGLVRRVEALGCPSPSVKSAGDLPNLATLDAPYCLLLAEADERVALERIREIRVADVEATVVWIATDPSVRSTVEAMRLGVQDVINGDPSDDHLGQLIRHAVDTAVLKFQRLRECRAAVVKVKSLTALELEVFQRLLAGDTNKQIAARLDKAVRTVELYRHQLMQKMGAKTPAEIVKLGVLAGLIEPWSDGPPGSSGGLSSTPASPRRPEP
jgi:FixJ family two-component response regulator